ncbi:MAG TPA: modification methylase [Patescibacteria group bacterium]|nr:modification methylase [Patescibacteria group bacterium]
MYNIIRNSKYDFVGQSYARMYPNLHKYPATMIPQIGIELFKELNIKCGKLLDPYCGSGSSFTVGLDRNLNEMYGFDINPFAVLVSRTKFTKVEVKRLNLQRQKLRNDIFEFIKKEENLDSVQLPQFYNVNFWFSKQILLNLAVLKLFINKIKDKEVKRFFWVPFSETIRECSYTRNHEFKLYRMKIDELIHFNPDVFGVFFEKLNKAIYVYEKFYFPKLNRAKIEVGYEKFKKKENYYDVVLTSPPYGDSKTTVAYGQFSMFSNEWMGIKNARQIDYLLMGGKTIKAKYNKGIIADYINQVEKASEKRALEVSSFYFDLDNSINDVAKSVKKGGKSMYIVGNRRVKNIQLPTDQFIAEKFEEYGFTHLFTYKRMLGNKTIPLKNSPTNKIGQRVSTMTHEYIVVCEKIK